MAKKDIEALWGDVRLWLTRGSTAEHAKLVLY